MNILKLDETHDPDLRSWVTTANAGGDFPLQNLPIGVFRRSSSTEQFRGGIAIGDQILDLKPLAQSCTADTSEILSLAAKPTLNDLMASDPAVWSELRLILSRGLRIGAARQSTWKSCLVPQAHAEYSVPAHIGDFTDFYTSIYHATTVGRMFRPETPLLPNYRWLPIAYHGRSSSIATSGQAFPRPVGQILPTGAPAPIRAPCRRLDYELELGLYVGGGNRIGSRIAVDDAESHLFGVCLLNDWSARDIQGWEYQPLGPFLAKNFATTISPWIVTLDALRPFRVPWNRAEDEAPVMGYLDSPYVRNCGALDVQLEVLLSTEEMRRHENDPVRLSLGNAKYAYWTMAQMVAHHTSNGCNLRPGDLLGTGTQSGPRPEEAGSLLELSSNGKQPITLPDGEQRTFLEDGDTVIIRGWAEKPGVVRIGFGEVTGTVLPAVSEN